MPKPAKPAPKPAAAAPTPPPPKVKPIALTAVAGPCACCGNPVAVGVVCPVDGTVA